MCSHIRIDLGSNHRLRAFALSKFPVKVWDGGMNSFFPHNFVFSVHVHQRRREGKSYIPLIIDSVNRLAVGIIAMPVRPSERNILWHFNSKVGVVILSWTNSD